VWWATRVLARGAEPASRVPALPMRRHVARLEAAGWSRSRIARAAQVAPSTITRAMAADTRQVSRIVAAAVLDVRAEP